MKKWSSSLLIFSLLASFTAPAQAQEAPKTPATSAALKTSTAVIPVNAVADLSILLEQVPGNGNQRMDPAQKITYKQLFHFLKQAEKKGLVANVDELTKETPALSNSKNGTLFVTREDLAHVLGKLSLKGNVKVNDKVLNYFTDASSISATERANVAYSVLEGVFAPKLDGRFDPKAPVTVGELSACVKLLRYDVIDILTTNDIHGNIEVGLDKTRNAEQGGMETIGGIVADYRSINPEHTVVVDGGDAWQGTLISNTVKGKSVIDSFDNIKYDAMAIGNHEFDFTLPVLQENIKQAKTPIISANIIDEKTGKRVDWTKPYVIVQKGKYKVGIIGLSTPQTVTTTKSTNIQGLQFVNPIPVTKELAEELHKQGCEIVIVTSHLPGEQADQSAEIMGEMVDLAKESGQNLLDAIVGGHSHRRVAGKVNGIPVVEAQNNAKAVGHIQLFVDKKTKKVVDSTSGLLETYTSLTQADSAVHDLVAQYKEKIASTANRVEGTAGEKLSRLSDRYEINGKVDRDGISPLGALITDAMRAAEKSDIAFTNIGGIRADVDKGEITYSELFSVLPFGNYDVTGTMTAQQIKSVLEVSDKYSKLPALQFSGLKVEWDATRAEGDRFTKITLTDGTPVYVNGTFATGTFTVTTNDFLATGSGDGYKVFGEVKEWKDGVITLDAFVKYVNALRDAKKEVLPENDGRDVRLDLKK